MVLGSRCSPLCRCLCGPQGHHLVAISSPSGQRTTHSWCDSVRWRPPNTSNHPRVVLGSRCSPLSRCLCGPQGHHLAAISSPSGHRATHSWSDSVRWRFQNTLNRILRGNLVPSESDRPRFLLGFDVPTGRLPIICDFQKRFT